MDRNGVNVTARPKTKTVHAMAASSTAPSRDEPRSTSNTLAGILSVGTGSFLSKETACMAFVGCLFSMPVNYVVSRHGADMRHIHDAAVEAGAHVRLRLEAATEVAWSSVAVRDHFVRPCVHLDRVLVLRPSM